jgi:hypothetical protein
MMQKFITEYSTKIAGVCLVVVGIIEFFGAENRTLRMLGILLWGVAVLALIADVVVRRKMRREP